MVLGAVTYNVLKDMDLEAVIRTLEIARYEGVELRTGHKHGVEPSLTAAERGRVRERFEASKVRLLSYGTTCEFQSADPAERTKQIDMAKRFGATDVLLGKEDPVKVPAQALMAKSPFWTEEYKEFAKKLVPGLDYREFDGVGHFLFMEKPKEVHAALAELLKKQVVMK